MIAVESLDFVNPRLSPCGTPWKRSKLDRMLASDSYDARVRDMAIRVLLADDHQIMREGLRAHLEREGDIRVVAEAQDGRESITKSIEVQPDVVVMDIGMSGMNGIEATRRLRAELPSTKVVILSMYTDPAHVLKALQAGASGYLAKANAADDLVKAIRAVADGKRFLSEDAELIVTEARMANPGADREGDFGHLGKREREVLQLVAEGKSSLEIAASLNISVRTVETHRHRIMHKLGLHSVADLTKYAVREGLTELES